MPVAADLYDPFPVENLHYARALGEETAAHDRREPRRSRSQGRISFSAPRRSSASSTRAPSSTRGASVRATFRQDPTLARLLAVVPFGTPAEPDRGDRDAGRRAVGAEAEGPLVLFGGIYDWYDPGLLLEAWPDILRGHPRRETALLREPEPRNDAAARLRARSEPCARNRPAGSDRFSSRRGCPIRRARTSTPRRTCSSRSPRRGWRRSSPIGRDCWTRPGAASRRCRSRGGTLARELSQAGAAVGCARDAGELGRGVSSLLADGRGAERPGAAARAFAAARRWAAVDRAPGCLVPRRARRPGASAAARGRRAFGERLKNLFR